MSADISSTKSTATNHGSLSSPWAVALAAIVGAEFLLQLDGTIANVALPTMRQDLRLDVPTASWVLNGFFLAFGGLLLAAGRLGDVLGHRRLFLIGIGLVTLASLVAGLAPNFPVLLVGRVLQGAGAALAGPAGLALLAILFDGERQQRAFGFYSTVTALGASAGLILGALLTSTGSWRWSLLINVPIGLAIIGLALRAVGTGRGTTADRSLGIPSAVLVTATLTAAVYGLVNAADHGWASSWTIIPLALVLLGTLLAVDSRAAEPMLPGRVFANRARLGGFVNLLLLASVLTGFLFYTSQYLHSGLGLDALHTGLALLPFGLALLAATQLLTKYIARVSLPIRGVIGMFLVVVALVWLARLGPGSTYFADVFGQIIILGVGVGIAVTPFNMIVLTTSDPADTGITAGLLQASLTIGGSLGLAMLLLPFASGIGAVFTWGAIIAGASLILSLLFWFGPGARKPAAGVATTDAAADAQ
ncbi:MFS transporter [Dactylosporangium sp. NPDC000555]|uniref:MFS transporter n=1 Tax=Dactylosporangium sp. NPDC000555 TaxID=3154260 RepID=UPI003325E512